MVIVPLIFSLLLMGHAHKIHKYRKMWTIEYNQFKNNTSDGIDLLYLR